ncbi:catalase-like [Bradysia coprophila]|uniref:catalase-like n=1 Tax=Bradysia coprophila TaxID=38358 RepID=UPI00187D9992|nr:catalase-like [Bradysia coprophila]
MRSANFFVIVVLALLKISEAGGSTFNVKGFTTAFNQTFNYGGNGASILKRISDTITNRSAPVTPTVGSRSSSFAEDFSLFEKLQSHNRERILDRIVHAKGAGALGYFIVTNDVTKYTKAGFLQSVGQRTNVAVRFSTVHGESGSADTAIDPKGFATKFYTDDGIYDFVGMNGEVFPIRDVMLFADLNRSRKRNPYTHLTDYTAWWDFTSLCPETTLHTLQMFSDEAMPKSLTYIDGHSVHTYKLINAKGSAVYVKLHWTSNQQNKEYFTLNESIQMAGTNPDFLIEDLRTRIERKEYPSWTLSYQVMTLDQATKHYQNPFDITKFWKREDYPLIPVGLMVLDKNPTDYLTQIEQLAFNPSNLVPGIASSPDRILQARIFSYSDAQLHRLGTNFAHTSVNKCPFETNTNSNPSGPIYFPNSFSSPGSNFKQFVLEANDTAIERIDDYDDDYFSLATFYLEEQVDSAQRKRICSNIATFLGKAHILVQRNFLKNIAYNVSKEFGDCIKSTLCI